MEAIYDELQQLLQDVIVRKPEIIKEGLTHHFELKPSTFYRMAIGTARPNPDLARLIIAEIKKLQAP